MNSKKAASKKGARKGRAKKGAGAQESNEERTGQLLTPGTTRKVIPRIEELAEDVDKYQTRRADALEKETESRDLLDKEMAKHGLTQYDLGDDRIVEYSERKVLVHKKKKAKSL